MSFRWTPGCCCETPAPTYCEDLIASGQPLPRVAWGEIDDVLTAIKQQSGTSNQYGWLWFVGFYNGQASWGENALEYYYYRTLFDPETGLTKVDANGDVTSYSPGSGPASTSPIPPIISSLRSKGREVFGMWHKCDNYLGKTQVTSFGGIPEPPYTPTYTVTLDSMNAAVSSVTLPNGRSATRQTGESDEVFINRLIAANNYLDVRMSYRPTVNYNVTWPIRDWPREPGYENADVHYREVRNDERYRTNGTEGNSWQLLDYTPTVSGGNFCYQTKPVSPGASFVQFHWQYRRFNYLSTNIRLTDSDNGYSTLLDKCAPLAEERLSEMASVVPFQITDRIIYDI